MFCCFPGSRRSVVLRGDGEVLFSGGYGEVLFSGVTEKCCSPELRRSAVLRKYGEVLFSGGTEKTKRKDLHSCKYRSYLTDV